MENRGVRRIILFWGVISAATLAQGENVISIPSGTYFPFFSGNKDPVEQRVSTFRIDRVPVTNAQFAQFLKAHPEWHPKHIAEIYAETRYLSLWKGGRPLRNEMNSPVVFVSWFAADAYCAWRKGRLPTTQEWEYVAAAGTTKRDASRDLEFTEKILNWYSRPTVSQKRSSVGTGKPNAYGIYDLHELIWEWTSDYNSFFMNDDSRLGNEKLKAFFCGSASIDARNPADYAAFMRYSMRSSLSPDFTLENLGFRCAYDNT